MENKKFTELDYCIIAHSDDMDAKRLASFFMVSIQYVENLLKYYQDNLVPQEQ